MLRLTTPHLAAALDPSLYGIAKFIFLKAISILTLTPFSTSFHCSENLFPQLVLSAFHEPGLLVPRQCSSVGQVNLPGLRVVNEKHLHPL